MDCCGPIRRKRRPGDETACNHMCSSLQPYVPQPATSRAQAWNPTCHSLQPYVPHSLHPKLPLSPTCHSLQPSVPPAPLREGHKCRCCGTACSPTCVPHCYHRHHRHHTLQVLWHMQPYWRATPLPCVTTRCRWCGMSSGSHTACVPRTTLSCRRSTCPLPSRCCTSYFSFTNIWSVHEACRRSTCPLHSRCCTNYFYIWSVHEACRLSTCPLLSRGHLTCIPTYIPTCASTNTGLVCNFHVQLLCTCHCITTP